MHIPLFVNPASLLLKGRHVAVVAPLARVNRDKCSVSTQDEAQEFGGFDALMLIVRRNMYKK